MQMSEGRTVRTGSGLVAATARGHVWLAWSEQGESHRRSDQT